MKLTVRVEAKEHFPALLTGRTVPPQQVRVVDLKRVGELSKKATVALLRDIADRIESGRYS